MKPGLTESIALNIEITAVCLVTCGILHKPSLLLEVEQDTVLTITIVFGEHHFKLARILLHRVVGVTRDCPGILEAFPNCNGMRGPQA